MISKQDANHNAIAYIAKMPARVEQFLYSLSVSGAIGGVFTYSIEPQNLVNAICTALQANGWTAVNDSVGLTITIS